MNNLFYIFIFFFGLIVGSFLNVVILRLGTGQGIVKKRSHCPRCGHGLAWFELVPLVSFLILRGRCHACHHKISWQYPLVELATGLLFLSAASYQLSAVSGTYYFPFFSLNFLLPTLYFLIIISFLVIIFVYDLRTYIIPDKVIFPAIIVALIYQTAAALNFVSPPLNLRGGWGALITVRCSPLVFSQFTWPPAN